MICSKSLFIAIIGDIKKSKEISDRKTVQKKLNEILNEVNSEYKEQIASKFIITLGDEFQGLLKSGKDFMEILEKIQRDMYPVLIRFGIGVGEITTDIDSEMSIGADGPGYYNARKSIEIIKQNEQKNKIQTSDINIEIEDDHESIAMMLNTIFILMTSIKSRWTSRQREIIYEYERTNGSQLECAKRMNIYQSTVQRSLVSGKYYAYKNAKDTINKILENIGRKDV